MRAGPEPRSGAWPDAAHFLACARAAATRCGVTRLADVTGLDRLGLPVWQAVRPAGRSLSVHQGKGATAEAARIGALCEAIEAHCAETAPADGPLCRFPDLAEPERAPEIGDYCRVRNEPPDPAAPIQWCRAFDLATGRDCYLPHDLVSLDYTRGLPNAFERVSSGLGAGAGEADALATSLLELIERDAVGEWQRLPPSARRATSIRVPTIPFDWFQRWRDRFASLDIAAQVFRAASLADVPVFVCVIGGIEEFGPAYRRFYGTAAHGDPEAALFKALAEAIQSRLTLIAGVRDDIMPSYYARPRTKPPVARAGERRWDEAEPLPGRPEWLAERLAQAGYPQVAVKRLDDGRDGVAVTRAFVPGLGSSSRTRRAAP
jgi:ribosomal protein S12 methylthiotransferase accessory factor